MMVQNMGLVLLSLVKNFGSVHGDVTREQTFVRLRRYGTVSSHITPTLKPVESF